ncbi:NAD-dependent epimerase/dehydratase family protein [Shimia sp. CNT1-13L.2]|uniref:NAD-dependent epimerase/dehydratase family protein n=1 Tax=Shimia sp. CNT1-13L.2 TaxID=2959663 RepID=UPI0020CC321B|nr:NAD-dependent epimerase/dehydratase family protein [Shimia sp. CNT1-13L.2]MCP9480379.1 NAD-dependent epimerase/dehydratase family protein [Shimia sp. CNT1-13L.2]
MQIDTTSPVMVTGATGYVAGWIVKGLLDAGLTVHAPVRNPQNLGKVQHLLKMAENSPGTLRLFKADLLDEGSYAEAMQGCAIVFHTASPFSVNVKDPQTQLIDPAVKGTRNVLAEASRTDSVKRVVLTSSCAAIYTDAIDCATAPNGTLTEDIWNTTASLEYQPYSYSKLLAEKAAWEVANDQSQWDLVVVNPSLVIGPATNQSPTSESFNIVRQIGDGTMKAGAPRAGIGLVDVRDLAQAHIAAAFTPEAEGRHIISGHNSNLLEMGLALQSKYGDLYPLPKKALPKWLVWLVGPLSGIPRKFVSNNVNVEWRADNSKGKRTLGVTYRPLRESMEDMFTQMVDNGVFDKA